ncbi:MAG: transcription termination/antitermination protein NusG [Acidimicrobiales bacterium]|nr:transcription termination/antitermination protein NusG [Acidimicrobiales bacterium]
MEAEGVEETTAAEEETAVESPAATTEAGASEASEATEPTKDQAGAAGAGAAPIADASADEETAASDEPEEKPRPLSPYDLPGDWYVIHSYSGYENKVKANLETRIQSMHMEDKIFEVHIPMEDVVEFKGGRKVTVPRKVFPGYLLVRMILDDDSWYAVRNTPGVTGFVAGNAQKPTPLSRREVERFLGVQEEEEKTKPRFKPEWEVGEQVRVVTGPFADFNGVIEEINIDQQKVVVLVNIFGRDTPVELGFDDIQKN